MLESPGLFKTDLNMVQELVKKSIPSDHKELILSSALRRKPLPPLLLVITPTAPAAVLSCFGSATVVLQLGDHFNFFF
jgi:hypothetical protein